MLASKEDKVRHIRPPEPLNKMIPSYLVIPLVWLGICVGFSPMIFGIIAEDKAERTSSEASSPAPAPPARRPAAATAHPAQRLHRSTGHSVPSAGRRARRSPSETQGVKARTR